MADSSLLIIVGLPFLASLATPLLGRRRAATGLMVATAVIGLVLTLLLFPAISGGGALRDSFAWAPGLGLDFTLRVDGLSWLFMMLIFGIGLLVAIYASYYMPREDPLTRLYALLLAFMGAMLGIVMSGNVIQLVFFWELTSLLSFLLIGYWHQGESARDAAHTSLIVTATGGLCLLAGAMVLGHIAGSFDLDAILAARQQIQASPLYLPALILILLGALTKSAQFPFHFWLPQAMSAPTPVSAYLHSATMVKAGVFLLLRFWPVLAGTSTWFWLVGGSGLLSLVIGAWAANFHRDLKAVLAYSTISHLGLITMLLGLGNALGAVAAIFHIVNHATFKASLFMVAGAVDNETGTRDLEQLGGLRHVMPITTTLAIISSAAMAGVPLLNGFLSKEMFFAVTLDAQHSLLLDTVTVIMAVAGSALSVSYSTRLVAKTFFGRLHDDLPKTPAEPVIWMRLPIGLLALACLAVGVLPALVIGPALHAAAVSVLGALLPNYSLAIWHGLNLPLLMSFIALVVGYCLYLLFGRSPAHGDASPISLGISAKQVFDRILTFASATLPAMLRRVFPGQRLQVQLLLMVGTSGLLTLLAARHLSLPSLTAGSAIDPGFALLWLLGCACAVGAATVAKFHRMTALALNGGAGLVVCISFVWLSAPDLAAMQLVVETVTTVLLLLGLRWLPRRIPGLLPASWGARYRRWRDLIIALGAGLGVACLAYATMLHPVADSVSQFYLDQAKPGAGGSNVVNVILVDFRALDTLGEITVLAVVALTVFALLLRFRPATETVGPTLQQRYFMKFRKAKTAMIDKVPDYLAIPSLIMTLVTPLMALFGLHFFMRGHDLPGGGFVAGLTLTMALLVLYMARGARWVEARLRVTPVRWIGYGLVIAVATGLLPVVFGRPFLTSFNNHLHWPLFGDIPLHSAMLFDLGVFAVVTGAASLILVVLAHQALRPPVASVAPPPETTQGGE